MENSGETLRQKHPQNYLDNVKGVKEIKIVSVNDKNQHVTMISCIITDDKAIISIYLMLSLDMNPKNEISKNAIG